MIDFKNQIKALLIAIFTWMVVINGNELIIKHSPIQNQLVIGIIGLAIVLLWRPR